MQIESKSAPTVRRNDAGGQFARAERRILAGSSLPPARDIGAADQWSPRWPLNRAQRHSARRHCPEQAEMLQAVGRQLTGPQAAGQQSGQAENQSGAAESQESEAAVSGAAGRKYALRNKPEVGSFRAAQIQAAQMKSQAKRPLQAEGAAQKSSAPQVFPGLRLGDLQGPRFP